MKTTFTAGFLAFLITACASGVQQSAQGDLYRALQARRDASAARAYVRCDGSAQCDKAWRLAKVFVSDRSDMKIQQADDTTITTFNPIRLFSIGMRAKRVPGSGESSTIELFVFCKDSSWSTDPYCPRTEAETYEAFPKFIADRLN